MRRLALLVVPLLFTIGCGDKGSGQGSGPPADAGSSAPDASPDARPQSGKVKLHGGNTAVTFVGTKPEGKHEGGGEGGDDPPPSG